MKSYALSLLCLLASCAVAAQARPDLPADTYPVRIDPALGLPVPELRKGETTVTLHLTGPATQNEPATLYLEYTDPVLAKTATREMARGASGTYESVFTLYGTAMVTLRTLETTIATMFVAPGEHAEAFCDAAASHLFGERPPGKIYVGFRGRYAALNGTWHYRDDSKKADKPVIKNLDPQGDTTILGMDFGQYADYLSRMCRENIAATQASAMTLAGKQYLEMRVKGAFLYHLFNSQAAYANAYRRKHNLGPFDRFDCTAPVATMDKLYPYAEELDLDNPLWVYSPIYPGIPDMIMGLHPSLAQIDTLTGTDRGLVQDMWKSYSPLRKTESLDPLSADEEKYLKQVPYAAEAYYDITSEARRKVDEAIARGGFTIMETPAVDSGRIIEAIVAQRKGKAVFIDFWATWCGPCLKGMESLRPIKSEIAAKGVEIIYITGASSPMDKWSGMLAGIGGTHYYLTAGQWETVCKKYGIEGIPNYMIFDKQGHKTFQYASYPGNERIMEELSKVW